MKTNTLLYVLMLICCCSSQNGKPLTEKNRPVLGMTKKVDIQYGPGQFSMFSGAKKDKPIVVHYYKPKNFTSKSPIIFVLPGGGRNADDYRDAWRAHADKYGLLVLSPAYAKAHFPGFWNYNLAGMIYDINPKEKTFKISRNEEDWIFGDFDKIFEAVKSSLNLERDTYDMFGHSAGGQLLHRLAIFSTGHKADRIFAANSGWYTLPHPEEDFPYGLKDSHMEVSDVDFSSHLTILLGEKDNADETRGHLRHSPEADRQGLHRLARGKYFYKTSKKIAQDSAVDFNWELEVVPGIGHDYKGMSQVAADLLYGTK